MYIDLLWNFNAFLVVIVFITDNFVFYYFRVLDFYGGSLVNYKMHLVLLHLAHS